MKVYSIIFSFQRLADWNNHAKCLVLNTFSSQELAEKAAKRVSKEAGEETELSVYEQSVLDSVPERFTDLQSNFGKYLSTFKNGELIHRPKRND